MEVDRRREPSGAPRRNATLGWAVVIVLCALAVVHALEASYRWFVFTGLAVAIVALPPVAYRDPLAVPPWELLLLVSIPVVDAAVLGETFVTAIAIYVAVAAVALVAVVELHRFTPARMTPSFAIVLVAMTTLAVAATWNVVLWIADVTFGTAYIVTGRSEDAANHAMMMDFVYAAVAGLLAGVLFDRYVMDGSGMASDGFAPSGADGTGADDRASNASDSDDRPASDSRDRPASGSDGCAAAGGDGADAGADEPAESTPSLIRGRLGASERTVRRISRALQLALGALFLYGLLTLDVTTIANAGIALAITFLPALLERDLRLPLEPELVLWITGAVFLHALGSAGLYDLLSPWDSLTHAVSASIVAAAGYAVVRAVDLYTDEIYLPPKLLFVFILLFVLAFGVVWELMEFALGLLSDQFGIDALLAQHGITDTIGDLFYDLVGAVVVATWGSVYLTDVSYRIADHLEG